MWKSMMAVVATAAIMLVAATSRSDVSDAGTSSASPSEVTTETPVMPAPGAEQPPRDPFAPFDIGPPQAAWQYTDLTAEEKAVVDRRRDTSAWTGINAIYAQGAVEGSVTGRARFAQRRLGVENIGDIGVVP